MAKKEKDILDKYLDETVKFTSGQINPKSKKKGHKMAGDDCPCKSVIEIRGNVEKELALIGASMAQHTKDFDALAEIIHGCVEKLIVGTTRLELGAAKFETIETKLGEHTGATHKKVKKDFRVVRYAIAGCFAVLAATGHASEIAKLVEKIVK